MDNAIFFFFQEKIYLNYLVGLGDLLPRNEPTYVTNAVKSVSCGFRHTIFYTYNGDLMVYF